MDDGNIRADIKIDEKEMTLETPPVEGHSPSRED